jgi:DNA-binding response OmpR family regulator
MRMRIAILLEDMVQTKAVSDALRSARHVPHAFERGVSLLSALERESFDAVALDWTAPDMHGVDVVDRIRSRLHSSVPVLCIGRDREADVVTALRRGADGYMIKPLRGLELVARLEALSRRSRHPSDAAPTLEVGPFRVDFQTRTIEREGRSLRLTATDFEVSVLFLRNIGRLLSRGHLRESVWGPGAPATSRTVDTYVCRVRKRLGLRPEHGWHLEPVYGYGYRLTRLSAAEGPATRQARALERHARTQAVGHAEHREGRHVALRPEPMRGASRPAGR